MNLLQQNKKVSLLTYFLIAVFILIIGNLIHTSGLLYFTDSISYLEMTDRISKGYFPHSDSFSPGYSFFVFLISKLFSITPITSLYITAFILIFCSAFLMYRIFNSFNKQIDNSFQKNLFLTFLLLINWLILKIILTAHADALFFLLLSLYFLLLINWLQTSNIKWLILLTLVSAVSVWIKYNAIILVPFLVMVSLINNNKKTKHFLLLIPLLTTAFSFYLFKKINGTVIEHFQNVSLIEKIENSFKNADLFYNNFSSSGRVYFSSIFSKSAELLIPQLAGCLFMILILFLFVKVYFVSEGYRKIENIFLLFSVYYWFCFFMLCQYTEWEELNARTLFPAIVSFIIWALISFQKLRKPLNYLVYIIVFQGLIYSFIYALILNHSDEKKFLHYLSDFDHKPSVLHLKKMMQELTLDDKIYTNESRNLSYALNYKTINDIPAQKLFKKGKFRQVNDAEYNGQCLRFYNEFKKNNVAVLIFDNPANKPIDSVLIANATNIYRFNRDYLVVHILK